MRSSLAPLALLCACALPSALASNATLRDTTPIVGGPCDGCEAVFQGLPEKLHAQTVIAPPDAPGERMIIQGQVRDLRGRLVPGIIIYAYHTDHTGLYPPLKNPPGEAAQRHGRFRGWVRTDEEGRYEFETIRPAGYPQSDDPAHVHLHVLEPGRCTYYIDNIVFDDDPRLTAKHRQQLVRGRGHPGLTHPRFVRNRRWIVRRDIMLGAGILDYPP